MVLDADVRSHLRKVFRRCYSDRRWRRHAGISPGCGWCGGALWCVLCITEQPHKAYTRLDVLGHTAFTAVQSDIKGNIAVSYIGCHTVVSMLTDVQMGDIRKSGLATTLCLRSQQPWSC